MYVVQVTVATEGLWMLIKQRLDLNPDYSHRKMALELGVSSTTVSRMVKMKRKQLEQEVDN